MIYKISHFRFLISILISPLHLFVVIVTVILYFYLLFYVKFSKANMKVQALEKRLYNVLSNGLQYKTHGE